MPTKDTTGLLSDEEGEWRRSLRGEWIITYKRARLDGDALFFSLSKLFSYEPKSSLELLGDFIRLADGSDTAILRFARKHGSLGLCKHGLPSGHWHGRARCYRQVRAGEDLRESLAAWRQYASRARAIVNLVSEVKRGQDGDSADWAVLGGRSMTGRAGAPTPKRKDQEYQRQYLAYEVRAWLNTCGTTPALTWDERTPTFRLRNDTLIGVIGVALMSAFLGRGGPATCSACGSPYAPKRKPPEGRNHYCDSCRDKAPKRLWARKRRREETEKRQMASEHG